MKGEFMSKISVLGYFLLKPVMKVPDFLDSSSRVDNVDRSIWSSADNPIFWCKIAKTGQILDQKGPSRIITLVRLFAGVKYIFWEYDALCLET